MTQFDSGHHGHFERAFPQLTPGVKILLALNVACFVIKNIGFDLIANTSISRFVGLSVDNALDGYGLGLIRLVTYQFFHSMSLGHLVWNMIFLYFFGTMAEGMATGGFESSHLRRGRTGIITLYLASGAVGGVVFLLLSMLMGETSVPVIGASGAVYGIAVYAACMHPRQRLNMLFVQPELRYVVGFMVFAGVYYQLIELRLGSSGVANSAHLGGALWGYVAYRLVRGGKELAPVAWLQKKQAETAARSAHREQEAMDVILDKVHKQGMNALTAAERRFLEKMSKKTRK